MALTCFRQREQSNKEPLGSYGDSGADMASSDKKYSSAAISSVIVWQLPWLLIDMPSINSNPVEEMKCATMP
jgi:hypothetical protein